MYKTINVVQHFGARGDNTTDDTTAFTSAITAASLARYGGSQASYGRSIIYVPPGIYKITSQLNLGHRQIIQGDGRGTTKLIFAPSNGAEEYLACISASGGPTVNDYLYEPEVRDLSIELETTSQTAINRYGIYFHLPTRAVISDVQITTSTLTSKDWVGLRTGREQGVYSNLFIQNFPVSIQLDLCDNANFNNIVYYNGSSTPSGLPRSAIYAAPSAQLDRISFTGKHVVVGFNSAIDWKYTGGVSSDGLYLTGFRCEQPVSTSGYRFDFGGTAYVRNIVIRDTGVTGNTHLLRGGSNTLNVDLDSVYYEPGTTGKTAINMPGLSPSNYNYFSATKSYFHNSSVATLSGFTGSYTTITLPYRLDSSQWILPWGNAPSTYYIANSFKNYATTNSGVTNLDDLTTTGIHDGHHITILIDSNTTVVNNATQKLSNTLNFSPPSGGSISLIMRSGIWHETSRTIY